MLFVPCALVIVTNAARVVRRTGFSALADVRGGTRYRYLLVKNLVKKYFYNVKVFAAILRPFSKPPPQARAPPVEHRDRLLLTVRDPLRRKYLGLWLAVLSSSDSTGRTVR